MSRNSEAKPSTISPTQSDEMNNENNSPQGVSGTLNFVLADENSALNYDSGDLSGTENGTPISMSSTPNELERTFDERYASEHRDSEKSCKCVFVEHTRGSKTKPVNVLSKTKAHDDVAEYSPDYEVAEQLKYISLKPASIGSEHESSKIEKKSTNDCDKRRRLISDEEIFKFDEDLERDHRMVVENEGAANNVNSVDAYQYFRNRRSTLYSDFFLRLRGLNQLMMSAEVIRKFMVHKKGEEDYKGQPLPERDIVRKSSLNALYSDKRKKFDFESLDRGMKTTWNYMIMSLENFLRQTRTLFRMYRQNSSDFNAQIIRNYYVYIHEFKQDLDFTTDMLRYRYDNLSSDRDIDACLQNLCNLVGSFNNIYNVEQYLLREMLRSLERL